MKASTSLLCLFTSIVFLTSCSKDYPTDDLDLQNYHPELGMYERVALNDPYVFEGNWKTIKVFDWVLPDDRTTTERTETLTVTKTHWITDSLSVPYRVEFVLSCGEWLVSVYLQYPDQEKKLTIQYTDKNGYYHGSWDYMCSDPYTFATIQMEPEGSDPWRIDKVWVPNN
ncbi:MAG: hypothetical protein GC178_16570 [Flavobacteriales bacterium]|nr:hypothetical protein [Flavobacteriales bacterium]